MKTDRTPQSRGFPLQLVLIVPFVLQIFGAVGLVGYLSFKNGQKAVNDLAAQLMDRTGDVADEHLKSYLSIPHKVSQINAEALRMGWLNGRDRKAAGKFFWHQMQAYDLTYIALNLPTGEGAGAARYDGKTITIDDTRTKSPSLPKNNNTYLTDSAGNPTTLLATSVWDTSGGDNEAKEVRAKLFEPFFTTKPIGKGTGLGLSIGHQIVTETHRGKIDCYSTLGQGTEFVVQIPVQQEMGQVEAQQKVIC